MDMSRGTMDPLLPLVSTVPHLRKIYIFLNATITKIRISTIKYLVFICHGTINNVFIDTGSPSTCSVDMSIVPHPSVHGAPSSGHHGHLLDFFKIDFKVTFNMNAGIVFQSNKRIFQRYLLVNNKLMCYENI